MIAHSQQPTINLHLRPQINVHPSSPRIHRKLIRTTPITQSRSPTHRQTTDYV